MALGGGIFTSQNKILPGSYINFVSAARASAELGERGFVALPIALSWGVAGEVFTVTNEQFIKHADRYFGYDYTADEMQDLREVFKYAKTVYFYRLNKEPVKAFNTFATAKYAGARGNDIDIIISKNVDDTSKFDVKTYVDNSLKDTQTVSSVSGLVANDWVDFKTDAVLAETAGTPLTGGTDGSDITGIEYTTALKALEPYSFNVLICNSLENTTKDLCIAYVKRLRDDVGAKCQVVVYKVEKADSEAVISVENKLNGETSESGKLVYWVGGVEASCEVNKSCTNRLYNGELDIDVNYTQTDLEDALQAGKFIFHKVGNDVRVLEDINTLVTYTAEKNDDFKYNQTIRVIDQIANDIAKVFNTRYLGIIPNDNAGRVSLWNDIVKHHQELQRLRAIENFEPDDVKVEAGDSKKAVVVTDNITVVNAMAQLYMTVIVA